MNKSVFIKWQDIEKYMFKPVDVVELYDVDIDLPVKEPSFRTGVTILKGYMECRGKKYILIEKRWVEFHDELLVPYEHAYEDDVIKELERLKELRR